MAHEIVISGGDSKWEGGNMKCRRFAVYTTYRVAKETYGEEYAQKNYDKQVEREIERACNNFYSRYPEYLDVLPEKYVNEINEDRFIRQYSKMPLEILKAKELVGGEDNMDKILAKLYEKAKIQAISWQDFLDECNLKEEDLNIE